MATHSSILAWRIPWTKEPGRLQSMGLQRVRHDCMTNTFTFHHQKWARSMELGQSYIAADIGADYKEQSTMV